MAYKVLKPISQNGEMIATGTIVDASSWRNVRALINNRYLVEVLDASVSNAAPTTSRGGKLKNPK